MYVCSACPVPTSLAPPSAVRRTSWSLCSRRRTTPTERDGRPHSLLFVVSFLINWFVCDIRRIFLIFLFPIPHVPHIFTLTELSYKTVPRTHFDVLTIVYHSVRMHCNDKSDACLGYFTCSQWAQLNGENYSIHHRPPDDHRGLFDDNDAADHPLFRRGDDRQLELPPGHGVRWCAGELIIITKKTGLSHERNFLIPI